MPAWMFPALGATATKIAGVGTASAGGSSILSSLGGIGSVIGGLGSVASGLGLGGGDSAPSLRGKDMKQALKIEMKHRMKYARRFSKKFGFHPLVALGINPGAGSGFMSRVTDGSANFHNMGQGLDRALKGISQLSPQSRELNRLQLEQEKQRLTNMKLQNVGLLKQIQDRDPQAGVPASGITEENIPMRHPSYASGDTKGRALMPLEQLYRTGDIVVAMPQEGAQDFMSESFFAMAPYASKQIIQFLTTGRGRYPHETIEEFRDKLNGVEDFLRSHNEIRPDEYLTWHHDSGQIKVMRARGQRKKLFSGRSRAYKQQPDRYGGLRRGQN